MLPSTSLRAASTRIPLTLSQASAQVLPPIPLYRRLLRAHRGLPVEMRFMGDAYVKSEFRATRATENPLHVMAFLQQWKVYLDQLSASLAAEGKDWKGRRLEQETMDALSDEQVGQLYELMHASKDVWKAPEQLEREALEAEAAAKKGQ